MNKDSLVILLISSVVVGLLFFTRRKRTYIKNEEANVTSEIKNDRRKWPLPEGRPFSGVAGFLGIFFIFWAIICFCGGPDGQFGSISSIKAGLLYSGVAGGLFYYSFR